jgi:hypothetical protein
MLVLAALAPLVSFFQNCSPYRAIDATNSLDSLSHVNVKVFLASGNVGRTVMSCDDGNTWIHDQSDDDTVNCNTVDCNNSATAAHGLDAGNGWFFANYGWSQNGSVRRSQDGVNWQTLRADGWGDGLGYAKNILLLNWSTWFTSLDTGLSWGILQSSPASQLTHPKLVRSNDTFFAMGQAAPALALSVDGGQSWQVPAGFQPEWTGHIAKGNGIIVSLGVLTTVGNPNVGYEAYSTDGGTTWQTQQLFSANAIWAGPIYDGTQFVAWANGNVWKSADGASWTQTPLVIQGTGAMTADKMAEPVAYNATTGTYVAIPNIPGNSYSSQQAYRSADGVTWTLLDAKHFSGGHPLVDLVVGDMDSSFCQ